MECCSRLFALLKRLADSFGVSGFEDETRSLVISELEGMADELYVDRLGNVVAVRHGRNRGFKLVWDAHMDEIGFMVRHIDENGFIYFLPVGGWDPRVLPGQRVRIRTRSGGLVTGVIGVTPPHLLKREERDKVIPLERLYIDIGASSREEVEEAGIEVGSPIDLDRGAVRLLGSRVTGKAFDDRVGLAVLIEAFRMLDGEQEPTVYLVASTQEEVGPKGARVAAQWIQPHAAIAVDVTAANDVPEAPERERVALLGRGPVLKLADGYAASGLIASRPLLELLRETAEREGIPYQLSILPRGTTDASEIQLAGPGVPAVVVAVATRYLHSPVELLDLKDAEAAARLIAAATKRMTMRWYLEKLETRRLK